MGLAGWSRLPKIVKVTIVQILLLILLSIGLYLWKGVPLVIIVAILWVDKAILPYLKIHGEFGVELFSIPVILSGIVYGPAFGFLFGFLLYPFLGGLFEMITWLVFPPEAEGLPILPSTWSFNAGLMGLTAGLLSDLPFLMIVLLTTLLRNVLEVIVSRITNGESMKPSHVLNVVYNVALVFIIGDYFSGMVALI